MDSWLAKEMEKKRMNEDDKKKKQATHIEEMEKTAECCDEHIPSLVAGAPRGLAGRLL